MAKGIISQMSFALQSSVLWVQPWKLADFRVKISDENEAGKQASMSKLARQCSLMLQGCPRALSGFRSRNPEQTCANRHVWLALNCYPVLHSVGLEFLRPGFRNRQGRHLDQRASLLVLLLLHGGKAE